MSINNERPKLPTLFAGSSARVSLLIVFLTCSQLYASTPRWDISVWEGEFFDLTCCDISQGDSVKAYTIHTPKGNFYPLFEGSVYENGKINTIKKGYYFNQPPLHNLSCSIRVHNATRKLDLGTWKCNVYVQAPQATNTSTITRDIRVEVKKIVDFSDPNNWVWLMVFGVILVCILFCLFFYIYLDDQEKQANVNPGQELEEFVPAPEDVEERENGDEGNHIGNNVDSNDPTLVEHLKEDSELGTNFNWDFPAEGKKGNDIEHMNSRIIETNIDETLNANLTPPSAIIQETSNVVTSNVVVDEIEPILSENVEDNKDMEPDMQNDAIDDSQVNKAGLVEPTDNQETNDSTKQSEETPVNEHALANEATTANGSILSSGPMFSSLLQRINDMRSKKNQQ